MDIRSHARPRGREFRAGGPPRPARPPQWATSLHQRMRPRCPQFWPRPSCGHANNICLETGLSRRERRLHPRDRGSHQGIRRLRGGERGLPAGGTRHHPRPDRTERRRQDHLLQPAHQVPEPDARAHPLQRPRHHAAGAGRRRAPRTGALVPDLRRVPAPDGAGECPRRPAAQARRLVRFLALEARPRRLQRARAGADRRMSAWRRSRTRPRSSCPTAASARSRSPPRWRSIPRCCCSTSRWPAWGTRTSTASPR